MHDSNIGRWFQEDPIDFEAGDTNLYRVEGNSPANGRDPSGMALNVDGPGPGGNPAQGQRPGPVNPANPQNAGTSQGASQALFLELAETRARLEDTKVETFRVLLQDRIDQLENEIRAAENPSEVILGNPGPQRSKQELLKETLKAMEQSRTDRLSDLLKREGAQYGPAGEFTAGIVSGLASSSPLAAFDGIVKLCNDPWHGLRRPEGVSEEAWRAQVLKNPIRDSTVFEWGEAFGVVSSAFSPVFIPRFFPPSSRPIAPLAGAAPKAPAGTKPVHIDIGGEGRYPDAVNVNPGMLGMRGPPPVTSGPTQVGGAGAAGRPIPNLVRAPGEKLPYADMSVDIVTLQNTPIRPGTISEIARVIKPGGDIRLVGPKTPEVLAAHQQVADAVGGKVYQTVVGDRVFTNIIVPAR